MLTRPRLGFRLASFRSPQYGPYLIKLRNYKQILEQRIDLLIKILSLQFVSSAPPRPCFAQT